MPLLNVGKKFKNPAYMKLTNSERYFIEICVSVISGQTLPEGDTDRTTVCTGDLLRGSCPVGEVIAVKDVRFGTKLASICPLSSNATRCCDYAATDCFDPPYTDTAQQTACSGKSLCNEVVVGEADTSACGAAYSELNHYLTMEYYCITGRHLYIKYMPS